MKLIIDVNLSPGWSTFLRDAGHHAVHWTKIGPHNASDPEIMRYAHDNAFVVVTRDLDFTAILAASGARRPSVIQLRGPRQFPSHSGQRMLEALAQLEPEIEAGAIVTIDLGKTRFRLLPVRPQ